VLLALAGEGIACSGLDASPEMLAVARARAGAAAPRLVQARMQDFDLGSGRFALIYSAFRAFQHLYSVEDQLACLARVRAHLAPGGAFAFDVFHPRLDRVWEPESTEEEDLRFEQDGEQVVRFVRATRDPVAQILHLSMRYERSRAGLAVASEVARFRMRWFTRFELAHLLARAGFEAEIWGDFDRSPVVRESPALVVLARPVS
jgi:SAM-dependent methyltransferase